MADPRLGQMPQWVTHVPKSLLFPSFAHPYVPGENLGCSVANTIEGRTVEGVRSVTVQHAAHATSY